MKKAISTILSLVMLVTPLVGTACFADKPSDNVGAYVQNQERNEQFRPVKIAGCIAVGTVAVGEAMLAGLKIYKEKREPINNWIKTRIYEIAPYVLNATAYVLKVTAPVSRKMIFSTCAFLENVYSSDICGGFFYWTMMHPLDPLGLRAQRDQQFKRDQQL